MINSKTIVVMGIKRENWQYIFLYFSTSYNIYKKIASLKIFIKILDYHQHRKIKLSK